MDDLSRYLHVVAQAWSDSYPFF